MDGGASCNGVTHRVPVGVGLPLEPDSYFQLEAHSRTDFRDSQSGYEVIMSRVAPLHRLAFVQINCDDHSWAIPPHVQGYKVSTHRDPCTAMRDTAQAAPSAGEWLSPFDLLGHTHAAGVEVRAPW